MKTKRKQDSKHEIKKKQFFFQLYLDTRSDLYE